MGSRSVFQDLALSKKKSNENLDRFIPNRSATDFDYANYMLTEGKKENPVPSSPLKEAYQQQLKAIFGMNRTRILAFNNKPPVKADTLTAPWELSSTLPQAKPVKPRRNIPKSSELILDAPDLMDDYYLNLLDWGSRNVLAIALGSMSICGMLQMDLHQSSLQLTRTRVLLRVSTGLQMADSLLLD